MFKPHPSGFSLRDNLAATFKLLEEWITLFDVISESTKQIVWLLGGFLPLSSPIRAH